MWSFVFWEVCDPSNKGSETVSDVSRQIGKEWACIGHTFQGFSDDVNAFVPDLQLEDCLVVQMGVKFENGHESHTSPGMRGCLHIKIGIYVADCNEEGVYF